MKKAIIHISDLHVTFHKDSNGEEIKHFSSYIRTTPNEDISTLYIKDFIDNIKKNYFDYTFILIVSGDISNKAYEQEFTFASKALNRICDELKIAKNDVLIVPGDHDVNWNDCAASFEQLQLKENVYAFDLHDAKFKKFKHFYDVYFAANQQFSPSSQIVNYIKIDEAKILLIGFNSNNKVGAKGADGYIDVDKASEELKKILPDFIHYYKIAIFHHNFIANYEDSYKGDWDSNNLIQFRTLLQQNDFRILLYGNEHTSSSEDKNLLMQSAVGSLGLNKPDPSFKVYKIIQDLKGLRLTNDLWSIINHSHTSNYPFGFWSQITSPNELNDFILKENMVLSQTGTGPAKDIPFSTIDSIQIPIQSDYKEYFFKLIKEKKLFHSGHFHWSETSRAHNWIDVSKILNDRNDLFTAKEAIIDIIKKNNLENKFDFIVGLGIEGNILSTRASVKYNKPYSFLPYSYRYDEHNEYEKRLNFDNDGDYKSVLIITDVVNDGRTIRKLIHKRAPEFFKTVESIIVISLFYTGGRYPISTEILNNISNEFNTEEDHEENRISYYFVLDMKVEKCPYTSKNYRTECLIVRENLGCVLNFYDEEKAHKKFIMSLSKKQEEDN